MLFNFAFFGISKIFRISAIYLWLPCCGLVFCVDLKNFISTLLVISLQKSIVWFRGRIFSYSFWFVPVFFFFYNMWNLVSFLRPL